MEESRAAQLVVLGYVLGIVATGLFLVAALLIYEAIFPALVLGQPDLAFSPMSLDLALGAFALVFMMMGFAVLGLVLVSWGLTHIGRVDPAFRVPAGLSLVAPLGIGVTLWFILTDGLTADESTAVLVGGGVSTLAGLVGLVLANRRASARYGEELTVPAVLALVPYLNIAGLALLVVRWNRVFAKLREGFVPVGDRTQGWTGARGGVGHEAQSGPLCAACGGPTTYEAKEGRFGCAHCAPPPVDTGSESP